MLLVSGAEVTDHVIAKAKYHEQDSASTQMLESCRNNSGRTVNEARDETIEKLADQFRKFLEEIMDDDSKIYKKNFQRFEENA